jgi:hypothetical protein
MSGGFFGHDAGQERRKRLDAIAQKLVEGAQYYAGPGFSMNAISQALSMANPIQDVGEAMGNARDGNYVGAAVNTASALAPVGAWKLAGSPMDDVAGVLSDTLSGVGMKAQGAMDAGRAFAGDEFGGVGPSRGIRAYHGSPHDFDKFSMDAIGTGEGAQAYGHGLYFAENEGVAKAYQTSNSATANMRYNGKPITDEIKQSVAWHLEQQGGDKNAVIEHWRSLFKPEYWETTLGKRELRELEKMDYAKLRPGSMYEVRINANPDDFLDWDAPLSAQPKILEQFGYNDAKHPEDWIPDVNMTGAELYRLHGGLTADGARGGGSVRQSDVLTGSSRPIRMKDGTVQDKAVNIPGIKYKDAGSRGMDGADGTRNYVVFDENLIEIVRKYGIAGAAALLGVSASEVQAAMGQRE